MRETESDAEFRAARLCPQTADLFLASVRRPNFIVPVDRNQVLVGRVTLNQVTGKSGTVQCLFHGTKNEVIISGNGLPKKHKKKRKRKLEIKLTVQNEDLVRHYVVMSSYL